MRISDWSSDVCLSDRCRRRNPDRGSVLETAIGRVTRVLAEHPVADPPADPVEFDALFDISAAAKVFVLVEGHIVALENLQLQRYRQHVSLAPQPYTAKGLDAVDHAAGSEERRVGKELESYCSTRGSPLHNQKKTPLAIQTNHL